MIAIKKLALGTALVAALAAPMVLVPAARPAGFRVEEKEKEKATGQKRPEPAPGSDLIVHEWGTFLAMSGSDGTSLDGMYHEEHALPPFVHARSRDQLRMPSIFLKGETPVIYFYTDTPQRVQVGVNFPKGVWTQWYPQAQRVVPSLAEHAQRGDKVANGRICWNVDVIPRKIAEELLERRDPESPSLPATSEDSLWNFARNVDAAYVRALNSARTPAVPEFEKYLFYRGLGEARLPVKFEESSGGRIAVESVPTLAEGIRDVFIVRVENGRAAYRHLPLLAPGTSAAGVIPAMTEARPLDEFTRSIADDLAGRLTAAGLYEKEARAMVNTWTSSYFQSEGIRLLFVLPQAWTDAFIPMGITPRPKQIVRVMVGRIELLSADRERKAELAVEDLTSPDAALRERAFRFLSDQGRYAEPVLRRVLRTTKSDPVRQACRALLKTELVTALRSAVNHAESGRKSSPNALEARAQLARLLREIGQDQEAHSHGVAILNELTARATNALIEANLGEIAAPPEEIRAAALEGTGVDRSAAAAYEACMRKRSSAYCGKLEPQNVAWFRDWWVGRAYARCLHRAGAAEASIASLEERLSPGGPAMSIADERTARMELAYIHEELGRADRVDPLWSSIEDRPAVAVQNASPR
ncbi:hypothetical protein [Aquisphaera insulae]|uniref:hypothetical protein n=1 Tax=Aquisphaera insulae TaxID=2712864 RepID=UPI0013ECC7F9|nr:hypothetical protein [Aquisphaera insulae]